MTESLSATARAEYILDKLSSKISMDFGELNRKEVIDLIVKAEEENNSIMFG